MNRGARRLTAEELERYSRQIVLDVVGPRGQRKLMDAKVGIIGLGGLGSPAAMQLAAMGIGHLRVVDCDVVELSNLHRQYLYGTSSIGFPKAEVAARRLRDLNPAIEIEPRTVSVNSSTAAEVVDGMDVIVDGLDRITPRYAINRACLSLGVPYVFGAAIMTYGTAKTVIPHETACLECFQGGLEDDRIEKCATVGVHPSVLGIISSVEVSEAVRIVTGEKPQLASKIFCCDIWDMRFDEVEIMRSEKCPACGSKPSSAFRLKERLITDICSRSGKRAFMIAPRADLDLDMGRLYAYLEGNDMKIDVRGELGATFDLGPRGKASVLKSGVMVIEGVNEEEDAFELYRGIIADGLSVPMSKIRGE